MPPRLYAHRGAAAELPENTIPAFIRAIEVGATALETDLHMTKDGAIVLSHDATGARMANVPVAIRDATLAEVQGWDVGWGFVDQDGGRPFVGQGFRMPTLDELYDSVPGVPVNVDAKQPRPDMTARLVAVIRGARAEERTCVASFDYWTLSRVRRAGYEGPTGLARVEAFQLLALPTKVLRLARPRGTRAQLPHRQGFLDLGKRPVIAKCHALGLSVDYWTVNDAARAKALIDVGADGIMTDDPRALAPLFPR